MASPESGQYVADFLVGPSSVSAFSRLSYTMWYALAEFVDNSTQSRHNYSNIVDDVLRQEGSPLRVEISYDKANREITITDNSIGMTREKLVEALKVANPTKDSKGRCKYGMGLKTAACWIGNAWSVTTCELFSGQEWTAHVDVQAIVRGEIKIPLTMKEVSRDLHYTTIKIWDLNRNLQQRTEQTIRTYLGSMYRFDIRDRNLLLLYNGDQVPLPEDHEYAIDELGNVAREEFQTLIGNKPVHGWFGVLRTGSRKFGGFSLFQHRRQIRGYPEAWKPRAVFGGIDDEGSNTLVAQRLTGEITLDGFDVSHTKDAILFRGTEEEELEGFLADRTRRLKAFSSSMRKGERGSANWSKEKLKELLDDMTSEFGSAELKDAVREAVLPPLSVIQENNNKQEAALQPEDMLWSIDVGENITVRVFFQNRSENDPHLTITHSKKGEVNIIINQLHPYYRLIDSEDRAAEMIRQFIFDAVAEYRAYQRFSRIEADAIRKLKDTLLRSELTRVENSLAASQENELQQISDALEIANEGKGE